MANLPVKDSAGSTKYLKESGAGTDGDPHVGHQNVDALPGTVETDVGDIKTAVEIIDNIVSGSEAQVDVVAALPAGENHLGEVGGSSVVVDLTLSLDTGGAYADGDVLAEVQELANALRVAGGSGIIHSLQVIDKDDQGEALDVVFFDASASLGTENSAVSISDADAAKILGIVEVSATDYVDLVNSQVASKTSLNIVAEVSSGTSLYAGAISRGTGTYTASGVVLRVGILQD